LNVGGYSLQTAVYLEKELTEYQKNAVSIKKYASDLQTFLALKQIEKEVETQETCLQSLVNSDKALIQQLLRQTFECWWL
jgi:hypothetical protein